MNAVRLAATRVNLLRVRRQLAQVDKGTVLLRRQREALVRELFHLARPAVDMRARIADGFSEAYAGLLGAFAAHGRAELRALAWPPRTIALRVVPEQVWGISVSDIAERPPLKRTLDARGVAPGTTGPTTSRTASRFESLAELLLDAAAAEQRIRRIGEAVASCSRRVRTLEQRVAPQLNAQILNLKQTLEEREREEHLRLKHVQRRMTRG